MAAKSSSLTTYSTDWSGLRELSPGSACTGQIHFPHPNTNLIVPRTALPVLFGKLQPGKHWLACAVLGLPGWEQDYATIWTTPPRLVPDEEKTGQFSLTHASLTTRLDLRNH